MVSALSERFLLCREADGSTRALALVRVDDRVAAVRPPDPRGSFAVACGLQVSPARTPPPERGLTLVRA